MHVILGALGSLVTILWLLHRLAEMGIDLGGLNPFLWQRRRRWKKTYDGNPVYKLESPMEATALLMTAVAKADGDMSREEKSLLLSSFTDEFHLSRKDAAGLLTASSHLLGKGEEVRTDMKNVLALSLANFTAEQAESALALLQRIATVAGQGSEMQRALIDDAQQLLRVKNEPPGKWS